jgi:hypothetical protein
MKLMKNNEESTRKRNNEESTRKRIKKKNQKNQTHFFSLVFFFVIKNEIFK